MNFLRYLKMVKFPFYTEQVRVYALPVLLFCENRLRCMIMGYSVIYLKMKL